MMCSIIFTSCRACCLLFFTIHEQDNERAVKHGHVLVVASGPDFSGECMPSLYHCELEVG